MKKLGVCQVWKSFTQSKATRLTSYQVTNTSIEVIVYDFLGYICLWDGYVVLVQDRCPQAW